MRLRDLLSATASALLVVAVTACTTQNPNYRPRGDAFVGCEAGVGLRCDGANLIRCNVDGTAEVSEPCLLGCNAAERRCSEPAPSNALGKFLDMAGEQSELNLGDSATIDADTGEVKVGGIPTTVYTETLTQPGGPNIRIFVVKGLVAKDVVVSGRSAIAVLSTDDVKLNGLFAASAKQNVAGAGAFIAGNCGGQPPSPPSGAAGGGSGGGGFGSPGGAGGQGKSPSGSAAGGLGGTATGNAELVPLRGGCGAGTAGGGGGAVQIFSRTQIAVSGIIATNGGGGVRGGGGSGGGVLLEAPIIDVTGRIVANGGGGGNGFEMAGEDGALDTTQAKGADRFVDGAIIGGAGGNGGTASSPAAPGGNMETLGAGAAYGGHGGGGVGRIRVNTASGGVRGTGIFSPAPSTGSLATR